MKPNRDRLRQAYKKQINLPEWRKPLAVTLTLRVARGSGINKEYWTRELYSHNLHHFLNVLNKKFFKSAVRKGLTLKCFPVLEYEKDCRPHYHLLLETPDRRRPEWFADQIKEKWRRTRWGYREVDVQLNADDGWIDYILKSRSKADWDLAIDLDNIRGLE